MSCTKASSAASPILPPLTSPSPPHSVFWQAIGSISGTSFEHFSLLFLASTHLPVHNCLPYPISIGFSQGSATSMFHLETFTSFLYLLVAIIFQCKDYNILFFKNISSYQNSKPAFPIQIYTLPHHICAFKLKLKSCIYAFNMRFKDQSNKCAHIYIQLRTNADSNIKL
jgi:hypothetical protein